ncbi:50S ribosomal protein L10 [Thermosediminibacter litoriperuensis]|uniref:Large ribosomal subunit protein uL10 n=1 Tax=Thermosediminibacter litoriperuensis TaxID=291989 RepID=A0A5S5AY03_9FIRM|nr:50S ribosomal protein L10 [Thermosediminibacter litoriperuensis]TYP58730.1 LSU ribosomal protein L10P [Thermosediminibacter litoriperuensis]
MGTREEKQQLVAELKDKFSRARAAILTDYKGLNVGEITELRRKLREQGVEYKVVKNTLTKLAIKDFDYNLDEYLEGPTAVAFGFSDPVAPAKVLVDFAKDHKQLEIKAGVVEGRVADKAMVEQLAKLPPKEELIAKTVGAIQSPLFGIVWVLQGPIRDLVYTLQAIQDKKAS